jgi:hypothetical protein
MFKKITSLSNLTLLVALSLSTIAAYYSIIGLTAIFAGAVIPIIVMGSILEVGKITTTVWLRKYWNRCGWLLKLYLVPAVVLLALLTSMGIFGFLSRAHSDQGLVTSDAQAKLAIYDEKIKTQRENIELARKALAQMDAQVDARLGRSDTEQGAERAVQIRRQQAGERSKLQKEIVEAQKEISKLNEERAPIAAETRKVEAEVGPIKYIAAMIYGDNPDANLLERAVRWVIILLVIVFDPLAIALVLAANASKEWDKEEPEESYKPDAWVADLGPTGPDYEPDDGPLTDEQIAQVQESARKFVDHGEHPKDRDEKAEEEPIVEEQLPEPDPIKKAEPEKSIFEQHPYLLAGFDHFKEIKPMVYKSEPEPKSVSKREKKVPTPAITVVKQPKKKPATKKVSPKKTPKIEPETKEIEVMDRPGDYIDNHMEVMPDKPFKELAGGYVSYDGKHMSKDALFGMYPNLKIVADNIKAINSDFGTSFPKSANKGDIFTRIDILPNKVFKFDGVRWIEVNKESSNTYLYNTKYLDYLIEMLDKGQYDPDLLSENERIQLEDYLKVQKLSKKID